MKHLRTRRSGFIAFFSSITFLLSPSVEVRAEEGVLAAPAANEADVASNDSQATQAGESEADAKFAFALADLGTGTRPDAEGTPRPILYQYCVPKTPEAFTMVGKTDPTGTINAKAGAKSPCGEDELSATGHTGQPNYLNVMRAIASHDFVKKITLVE